MIIYLNDAENYATFGEPEFLRIPITGNLYDMIDAMKKFERKTWEQILQAEGLDIHPDLPDNLIFNMMFSYVQNGWYKINVADPGLLEEVKRAHDLRINKYNEKLSKADGKARANLDVKQRPPRKPIGSIDQDAIGENGEVPEKKPKIKFKTGISTSVKARHYKFIPTEDAEAVKNLTGFRRRIYETLVAEPEKIFAFEEVLAKTIERGAEFRGSDGGKGQVQWQLGQLTKLGLISTGPAQGEIA